MHREHSQSSPFSPGTFSSASTLSIHITSNRFGLQAAPGSHRDSSACPRYAILHAQQHSTFLHYIQQFYSTRSAVTLEADAHSVHVQAHCKMRMAKMTDHDTEGNIACVQLRLLCGDMVCGPPSSATANLSMAPRSSAMSIFCAQRGTASTSASCTARATTRYCIPRIFRKFRTGSVSQSKSAQGPSSDCQLESNKVEVLREEALQTITTMAHNVFKHGQDRPRRQGQQEYGGGLQLCVRVLLDSEAVRRAQVPQDLVQVSQDR